MCQPNHLGRRDLPQPSFRGVPLVYKENMLEEQQDPTELKPTDIGFDSIKDHPDDIGISYWIKKGDKKSQTRRELIQSEVSLPMRNFTSEYKSSEEGKIPEGSNITWLRKHGYTNCPIASCDNDTGLYNSKLVRAVERSVDNYIINVKASKDANFKPRCFIAKLYFIMLYRVRRFLNTIREGYKDK